MTDPISDMLTRIRNASMAKKEEVVIPFSKVKFNLAKILEQEGFVEKVERNTDNKFEIIKMCLKYDHKKPVIASLKRISKPGRKIYVKKDQLPIVLNDFGVAIVSTSRGMMTNKEARKRKLGGELICEIY